jgi:hypothetical protein
MSIITIPGPIVRDVAEAAYYLLGRVPIGELSEQKDSEIHPEWWEEPFEDFDVLRGLVEALQPVESNTSCLVGDEHKETLMWAINEAIDVRSGLLRISMDEHEARPHLAQLENLRALRHELIVASGAVAA